jgi:hypothetical protein
MSRMRIVALGPDASAATRGAMARRADDEGAPLLSLQYRRPALPFRAIGVVL